MARCTTTRPARTAHSAKATSISSPSRRSYWRSRGLSGSASICASGPFWGTGGAESGVCIAAQVKTGTTTTYKPNRHPHALGVDDGSVPNTLAPICHSSGLDETFGCNVAYALLRAVLARRPTRFPTKRTRRDESGSWVEIESVPAGSMRSQPAGCLPLPYQPAAAGV
jgi:hypothetical protein